MSIVVQCEFNLEVMLKLIIFFTICLLSTVTTEDILETVDLLEQNKYSWDGLDKGSVKLNVTAEGYCISVTIETCDIGNHEARPNEDYLILRQGNYDGLSTEVGKRFAYITNSKTLYFYSSSVILEMKSSKALNKHCKITFEKADEEDTTLPPVTTTETMPTVGPQIFKYSTVFISGKKIEDFNRDKNLVTILKEDLSKMAVEYTKVEGYCLLENITTANVDIYVMEQCPRKWTNYETCVRLVYSIPVKIDKQCPSWKGYELTEEHLDIMWDTLADRYLSSGFHVYKVPSVENVITWWIVCFMLVTLAFSVLMIVGNLFWKRKEILRSKVNDVSYDVPVDNRRCSDDTLSPSDFQSTPPMFEGIYSTGGTYSEDLYGADNEGFQEEDEVLSRAKID